jgi:hypothetical protein
LASSLDRLIEQLAAVSEGALARSELRRWFTPYLMAFPPERPEDEEPSWDPDADDKALFWNLVWLFDDDSYTELEHRELATKVVRLIRSVPSTATALDILPLIKHEPKLCEVIRKHRTGIISRNGFLSVIAKNFQFDTVRQWLAEASPQSLDELRANLLSSDYIALDRQLSRPPA